MIYTFLLASVFVFGNVELFHVAEWESETLESAYMDMTQCQTIVELSRTGLHCEVVVIENEDVDT